MKKLYKRELNASLKAYSTMALTLTAGSTALNAEIVYNDIADETIGLFEDFSVDIDGDGLFDFYFAANGDGVSSGRSFGSIFGFFSSSVPPLGNSANQVIGYFGGASYYGSALDAGAIIGSGGPWISNPSVGNYAVLASNYFGATYGAFPGQGEKFLGFKFAVGGNVHYGWMRIVADVKPVTVTILDYAYNDTPDAAIEAGAEISIAITELPAGAVTIYSFGNTLNVLNSIGLENAIANVYDLSGKQIASSAIGAGLNQIDLSGVVTGNYLIQISGDQGETSKQVFIN